MTTIFLDTIPQYVVRLTDEYLVPIARLLRIAKIPTDDLGESFKLTQNSKGYWHLNNGVILLEDGHACLTYTYGFRGSMIGDIFQTQDDAYHIVDNGCFRNMTKVKGHLKTLGVSYNTYPAH